MDPAGTADPARLRSGREGEAMADEPGHEPVRTRGRARRCPSVPGDVWHWQLEAMHVVSRVRADLRARIAHPSVSSGSTDDARDGLLLVFEELASNALRHGGGDVRALVVAGPGGWLLDLSDEAPDRPPVPAVDRDPALGGMGLHLVAQLSTDYGWEGRPGPQARVGAAALGPARVGRRGDRAARAALPRAPLARLGVLTTDVGTACLADDEEDLRVRCGAV